jgi:cyclopropane fatty-acyl-phospholipid synthase-like methyltransferase
MKLLTSKPVALDSYDHICPLGTKNDNTIRPEFNTALYALRNIYALPDRCDLAILDIGCAGGGFVESCINDGCKLAAGLEGSNYSQLQGRAAWATIPANLFTCDVTAPFELVYAERERIPFDVVTAWEFMEHIATPSLPQVFTNIRRHLTAQGLFIGSIATVPCDQHHKTIKPEWWWRDVFRQHGFTFDDTLIAHFEGRWLRLEPDNPAISFGFVARLL